MLRSTKGDDPCILGKHYFKILQACTFVQDGNQEWVIELTVGKGRREIDGWVFIDRHHTELRFEMSPSMEPPGFLLGVYLSQGIDETSLALLFDDPSATDIAELEDSIRSFINKCCFSVRTLTELSTGTNRHEAMAYRYGCATIPIRK